jgi:uncharacterized protein YdbL (DUF1318 family)
MTVPTEKVTHADEGRVSKAERLGLASPIAGEIDTRNDAEQLADKLDAALDALGLTLHSAAGETPQLTMEEYLALRGRIKANGQRTPIVITKSAQLVDGRHRLMACHDLGLDPVTVMVTDEEAREAAFDSELRRHQTKSQMAAFTTLFFEDRVRELTAAGMSSRASKSEYNDCTEISPVTFVTQTAGVAIGTAKQAVALLNAGRIDLLVDVRDGRIGSMQKAYDEHLQAGAEEMPERYEQLVTALNKAKNALAQAERQAEEIEGLLAFVQNSDELKELAADIRKALMGIDDIDEILERVQPRA